MLNSVDIFHFGRYTRSSGIVTRNTLKIYNMAMFGSAHISCQRIYFLEYMLSGSLSSKRIVCDYSENYV